MLFYGLAPIGQAYEQETFVSSLKQFEWQANPVNSWNPHGPMQDHNFLDADEQLIEESTETPTHRLCSYSSALFIWALFVPFTPESPVAWMDYAHDHAHEAISLLYLTTGPARAPPVHA